MSTDETTGRGVTREPGQQQKQEHEERSTPSHDDPDVEIEVDDEPGYDLVVGEDDRPFTGEIVVTVERVGPPRHSKWHAPGEGDVRVLARCSVASPVVPGEMLYVFRSWPMACGGCRRLPGVVCGRPLLKPGMSGFLRRDAELALGRRARPKERLSPRRLFVGRSFVARLRPVTVNENGDTLPEGSRYSAVDGTFLRLAEDDPLSPAFTLGDGSAFAIGRTTGHTTTTHQGRGEESAAAEGVSGALLQRRDSPAMAERRAKLKAQAAQVDADELERRVGAEDARLIRMAERVFGGVAEVRSLRPDEEADS